jgi:hypothetical protein
VDKHGIKPEFCLRNSPSGLEYLSIENASSSAIYQLFLSQVFSRDCPKRSFFNHKEHKEFSQSSQRESYQQYKLCELCGFFVFFVVKSTFETASSISLYIPRSATCGYENHAFQAR